MMKWLPLAAALAVFAGLVLWLVVPFSDKSGIELGYLPLWNAGMEEDARNTVVSDIVTVVRRRLETAGIDCEVVHDAGTLRVKLPGATSATTEAAKRLLRTAGNLQLRPAAEREVQEKFNSDGVIPAGYAVVQNGSPGRGGEYEAWGSKVLLLIDPVIRSRNIQEAEPREERIPGGKRWVTSFVLDADGSKRFDLVAKELYNRRPPGLLGIVLDGDLKSLPAVQSSTFHGRGQISGAKSEQDARDLSAILRGGELVIPLGSRRDGKDLPGTPESERPYGPRK
jgi:preprotein translocase subunit SecD